MAAHTASPLAPDWLQVPEDGNALDPVIFSSGVSRHDDGQLAVQGIPASQLAADYGTPLLVVDEDDFRARARSFRDAFDAAFEDLCGGVDVYYAGKSFLVTPVARWIAEEGLCLDTASGGELAVALRAGVDPARIGLHGNNKSDGELRRALEVGVGRIVVDSLDELTRLAELAQEAGLTAPVMLRLTPGVHAHTHEFIATAHEDQKFGLSLQGGDAAAAAAQIIDAPSLELIGLHSHIGSQIFDKAGFEVAAGRIIGLRAEIERTHGVSLPEVDLGGGFGIQYTSQDTPTPFGEIAEQLADVVGKACAEHGSEVPFVSFEPGRAIAGPAMFTLYRVGTVKPVDTGSGVRCYVSVDGGMSDNIRTALYDADYSCTLANRTSPEDPVVVRVVGKHCESGDIIVRDEYLPADIAAGDLVAVPGTGAYCRPLASNYNHVPRPGVLAVDGEDVRWAIRPESYQDMFATDPGFAPVHENGE